MKKVMLAFTVVVVFGLGRVGWAQEWPVGCVPTTDIGDMNNCTGCVIEGNVECAGIAFVGGAAPVTYEGWQLAEGSPGVGMASDGLDMGVVFAAQAEPETITRGETTLLFDHDGINTTRYDLVVGEGRFTLTTQAQDSVVSFTLPVAVPTGTHSINIIAVGPGGETAGPAAVFEIQDPLPAAPTAPSAPRTNQ